jgi:putative hydrolase of the HAD superfamily
LIHLPRGVGWHYRHIASRHGLEVDEASLGAAFGSAFRAMVAPGGSGVARQDDGKGWWRGLVRRVLRECGHEPEEMLFHGMFEELYAHFAEPGVWALYPEALEVLEGLHGRCRLGIVSNFDRRLYPVLEELGIRRFFETVTISSELGVEKPDRRIFEAALGGLGVGARETIFVGDDPEQDWAGAEAAGMRVYRLQRPAMTLAGLADFVTGSSDPGSR